MSWLTLCEPRDCSPPSSSVHGISEARILEWVAISFSRGSSLPRDWNCIPWIGRLILYHWATSEAQSSRSIVVQWLSHVWPFGSPWLQHARLSCPSLSPKACSNSYPLSQWYHPIILSSFVPFSSFLQSFPASGSFLMSVLRIRLPKYWSFSISPSNEYSGLISFRMDWLDLLAVQGTLKSLLQHHSSKASVLWCSAFFS